jgi:hypothetical protein
MSAIDLQALDRFIAAVPERPQSFAERGVALPFTTPMLAGARLRHLPGEQPELILPSLGGRGVYVLDWPSCVGLAKPTLHDRLLWEQVAPLKSLTPATVRAASRAAAAQGFAGRAAQGSAIAALQALAAEREAARRQIGGILAMAGAPPPGPTQLDGLAAGLAEVGVGRQPGALLAARLKALAGLGELAAGSSDGALDGPDRQAALLAAAAVRLAQSAVQASLAPLHEILDRLPAVVAQGEAAIGRLLRLAERPDWLLDGWDSLAARAATVPPAGRGAVLRDVLAQLPVPPREADAWLGGTSWDAVLLGRRRIAARPGWLNWSWVDAVASNEQAQAMAA